MRASDPAGGLRSADSTPTATGSAGASRDPVSLLGSAMLDCIVEGQSELFRFLGSRLTKDAAALAGFAACRTPAEVLQRQLHFGSDAALDYLSEAQRMIGVLEKAASENLALVP